MTLECRSCSQGTNAWNWNRSSGRSTRELAGHSDKKGADEQRERRERSSLPIRQQAPPRQETVVAFAPGNSRPMTHYRAYAVQFDGNFDGYQSLNCTDDDDAIVKARQLAERSAIELWSGERFITRLEHKSR